LTLLRILGYNSLARYSELLRERPLNESAQWFRSIVSGERRGLRPALWRSALWWARIPYGIGVWVRNRLFDLGWKRSHRVDVVVVSIGNLTLGGTGKTPCVEFVAGFYRDHGLIAPIVSRGYGASGGLNDEALVLEENIGVPHFQDADRVKMANIAIEETEADVIVLDDGFQHRRLARNLDIVLIDASEPWGYGYLFPRGMLREGVGELRRAGMIVLTRCDHVLPETLDEIRQRVRRYTANVPLLSTVHRPLNLQSTDGRTESVTTLQGKKVAGFCGIGNPASFRRTLTDLGAEVIEFRSFPDHHAYQREDVDELRRWASTLPADAWVLTTQKDFVKLRIADLSDRPLWALRIGMAFLDGQDVFEQCLLNVVNA